MGETAKLLPWGTTTVLSADASNRKEKAQVKKETIEEAPTKKEDASEPEPTMPKNRHRIHDTPIGGKQNWGGPPIGQ